MEEQEKKLKENLAKEEAKLKADFTKRETGNKEKEKEYGKKKERKEKERKRGKTGQAQFAHWTGTLDHSLNFLEKTKLEGRK